MATALVESTQPAAVALSAIPLPPHLPFPIFTPDVLINNKYNQLGGASGPLGPDQSTLQTNSTTGVSWITYQHGGIYYHAGDGANAIYGDIYAKWVAAGGLNSNLGYPITDELQDTDINGVVCRHNDFKVNGNVSGSIWWTATDGAHLLYGNIWLKWKALGGIKQGIGYPITDEADTGNHIARFNTFKYGGAIYWSHTTGACAVYGVIYQKYLAFGGPLGSLGIPTTDELSAGTHGGRYYDFTGGSIYFSPLTGAWPHFGGLPTEIKLHADISFPGGTPVGGDADVTLRSNGDCVFHCHMHDSGFPSYNYAVACAVKDAGNEVYTFTCQGHLGGTLDPDSRDDFFGPQTVNNAAVAQEWRALVAFASMWTHTHVDWDVGALVSEVVQIIKTAYPIIVQVVGVISAVV